MQVYRHDIKNHGYIFWVVAVITQRAVENGEPLFEVDYNDRMNMIIISSNIVFSK